MRIYKYNKNGIKIIVKVDIPEEIVPFYSDFNKVLNFEYLGNPNTLYFDDSKYFYPSLLTYLNYDLFDVSVTFNMVQDNKSRNF